MKIQGKDITTNDTVKYGNVWVKVEEVEHTTLKNGKPCVNITGTKLEGVIKRSNGMKQKIYREENYKVTFKSETKVDVK